MKAEILMAALHHDLRSEFKMLDLNKPFPTPQLGLKFCLSVMRAQAGKAPTPEQVEHLTWAQHLLSRVQWLTHSPLLALAMWQLATNAEERAAFKQALSEIDTITKEAAG
jgi:hypothetical protein